MEWVHKQIRGLNSHWWSMTIKCLSKQPRTIILLVDVESTGQIIPQPVSRLSAGAKSMSKVVRDGRLASRFVRRRLCSCHQSKRCLRRSPFSCVNSLSRREVSQFIHFLFNISNRYMKTLSLSLRSYSYITVFFCVKETGGFRGYFRTPKFPRNLKCNV